MFDIKRKVKILDRVILHCDLNNFYASVECRDNPELRGKAVAVCGSTEERHGIVLAKSEKAKRAGVKTGMAVWEAYRLCPDIVIVPPHFKKYLAASREVRKIYDRFSDKIEPFGLDECFMDISGMQWTYKSGYEAANRIRLKVKEETGLTISVGVSYNKIFAKLGSDMKKPDAVTEITRENFRDKVWPLPAREMIYIGRATERKLANYGIYTIGDVAGAGPEFMGRVFGKNGIKLWINACGSNSDPVMPGSWSPEIKSVGHGITCTEDLETGEEVRQVMYFLAQEISYKLRKEGLYTSGIQIDIKDKSRACRSFQRELHVCTQNAMEITKEAYRLFTDRYDWQLPVRAVTVRAISIKTECSPIQTDMFFDLQRYDKSNGAEKAAMAVKEKFGKWTIRPASMLTVPKLPSGSFEDKIIFPEAAVRFLNMQ